MSRTGLSPVHALGPGLYETVARLGERDGVPMFTVTHEDMTELELAAPSAPYVRWIAAGLRETHAWNANQIAEYLMMAPGVKNAWTAADLAAVAGG